MVVVADHALPLCVDRADAPAAVHQRRGAGQRDLVLVASGRLLDGADRVRAARPVAVAHQQAGADERPVGRHRVQRADHQRALARLAGEVRPNLGDRGPHTPQHAHAQLADHQPPASHEHHAVQLVAVEPHQAQAAHQLAQPAEPVAVARLLLRGVVQHQVGHAAGLDGQSHARARPTAPRVHRAHVHGRGGGAARFERFEHVDERALQRAASPAAQDHHRPNRTRRALSGRRIRAASQQQFLDVQQRPLGQTVDAQAPAPLLVRTGERHLHRAARAPAKLELLDEPVAVAHQIWPFPRLAEVVGHHDVGVDGGPAPPGSGARRSPGTWDGAGSAACRARPRRSARVCSPRPRARAAGSRAARRRAPERCPARSCAGPADSGARACAGSASRPGPTTAGRQPAPRRRPGSAWPVSRGTRAAYRSPPPAADRRSAPGCATRCSRPIAPASASGRSAGGRPRDRRPGR